MSYFGESREKIKKFRDEVLNTNPSICPERAVLTTQAYRKYSAKQIPVKRALMLKNILENMSIYIEDNTLIAGNQASKNRAAPIFPEYAIDWVVNELDDFDSRDGDRFEISTKTKEIIRDIAPYWQGITLKDKGLEAFPKHNKLLYDLGIIKVEGNITSGDAHLAVSYDKILKKGLKSFREHVVQMIEKNDLSVFENLKKSYFYEAILIVLDATIVFAHRYSELALKMACEESNEQRKQELMRIGTVLKKVPEHGAESFFEAVQSLWLVHLVLQIESNGHSLSYGRMDQYLYSFYSADIAKGDITKEEASELLENLWIKTYTINKIRSSSHTKFSAGSPLYQNVTVAGQTIDGKDATNELSYLILQSVGRIKFPQPNLTVRYHRGLTDEFMKECMELIKLGFGMPAFNNDEIIIPSFIEKGVAQEDAYNYSAIGCVEVAVPGKWGYRVTGMAFLNFPRVLMLALNNGIDITSGKKVHPGYGKHFLEMESFDEVMQTWSYVIKDFTRDCVIADSCADLVLEQEVPDILCSALVDDCIARGKNIKEGGAIYDFISDLQVGIANLGDSLAAVKKVIFEDKLLTKQELWDALINDFDGPEGLRIQNILLSAPKYGNDDDYVDTLLRQAYDVYLDEIFKYKNTRYGRGPIGGCYYGGTSSISANVPQGKNTCATPDGRNAYTPLAEGCSPTHGADITGPTGVFKSITKLDTKRITGGVLLNQKVTPQMLESETNVSKLISLLRVFFDKLKGFHVQYNVVSREMLLDAQKSPQNYKDLIVRVAGYSAFFNVLSKDTQDDIIARTEQNLN